MQCDDIFPPITKRWRCAQEDNKRCEGDAGWRHHACALFTTVSRITGLAITSANGLAGHCIGFQAARSGFAFPFAIACIERVIAAAVTGGQRVKVKRNDQAWGSKLILCDGWEGVRHVASMRDFIGGRAYFQCRLRCGHLIRAKRDHNSKKTDASTNSHLQITFTS